MDERLLTLDSWYPGKLDVSVPAVLMLAGLLVLCLRAGTPSGWPGCSGCTPSATWSPARDALRRGSCLALQGAPGEDGRLAEVVWKGLACGGSGRPLAGRRTGGLQDVRDVVGAHLRVEGEGLLGPERGVRDVAVEAARRRQQAEQPPAARQAMKGPTLGWTWRAFACRRRRTWRQLFSTDSRTCHVDDGVLLENAPFSASLVVPAAALADRTVSSM